MLARFKKRYANTRLRCAYHRYVPDITVYRRFRGMRVYMSLRDNVDEFTSNLNVREEVIGKIAEDVPGTIWDVGANVGLFCLPLAKTGRTVVAFDQSLPAIRMLRRTCDANHVRLKTVPRAFGVAEYAYDPTEDAWSRNSPTRKAGGSHRSISFREAERIYGTPRILKMDIEGGEAEFFLSEDFKQWIVGNGILWIVEFHPGSYGLEWSDVPTRVMHCGSGVESHALICSNRERLFDIRCSRA